MIGYAKKLFTSVDYALETTADSQRCMQSETLDLFGEIYMKRDVLQNSKRTLTRFMGVLGLLASLGVASAALASDSLLVNQSLSPTQSLLSANGSYRFRFQTDGNLVLTRQSNSQILWTSDTQGEGGNRLTMQTDSNLVLYTSSNVPVWDSGTNGTGANRLLIQNDGNAVIYNASNVAVWATNTAETPAVNSVSLIGYVDGQTTGSSLPLARPSGVSAGDLLVLMTQGGDGQLPNTQSGWTQFAQCFERDNADTTCNTSGADLGLVAYYRTATSNEPSTYSVSRGSAGHIIAGLLVLRGADNATPIFSRTFLPNDQSGSGSRCPSTAGIAGGYHVCVYTHDDPQLLTGFSPLTLRNRLTSAGDSVHIASGSRTNGSATPEIRSVNDGATGGGDNDLQLSFVVRPRQ